LGVEPRTTGGFYREEAAHLASEAAKAPPGRTPKSSSTAAPQIRLDRREPLRPQPAVNQNVVGDDPIEAMPLPPRRNPLRLVARIVLAPWYAVMLVGSIGVDAWFIKDLLGF
jgi:hypothetical protein